MKTREKEKQNEDNIETILEIIYRSRISPITPLLVTVAEIYATSIERENTKTDT